jgi:hypothetical protein
VKFSFLLKDRIPFLNTLNPNTKDKLPGPAHPSVQTLDTVASQYGYCVEVLTPIALCVKDYEFH